jgi:hypothetical protein
MFQLLTLTLAMRHMKREPRFSIAKDCSQHGGSFAAARIVGHQSSLIKDKAKMLSTRQTIEVPGILDISQEFHRG